MATIQGVQRSRGCFRFPKEFKGTSLDEHKGKFLFKPVYTKKDQEAGEPYEFFNGLDWKEGGNIWHDGYSVNCPFALVPADHKGPFHDYDAFIKVPEQWGKLTQAWRGWKSEHEDLFLLGEHGLGMFPQLTYGLKIVAQAPAAPEPTSAAAQPGEVKSSP